MQLNNIHKNRPLVSIIIPTYNRNNILERAVKSVIGQTFQDFEILIIDDASTESPEKIVDSFNDDRINYICHKFNKGGSAARNTGIRASKGNYIAFLDSDDEWLPEKLECQITNLEKLPASVGAHYSGLTVVSSEGLVLGSRIPSDSGDVLPKLFTGNFVGPLSSVIVRRPALDHSGYFDEQLPSSQDWDLYIRIAQKYHFSFTKKNLVRYHLSNDSITKNVRSKAFGRRMIIKKYEDQMKLNPPAFSRQVIKTGHYFCRAGLITNGRKEFIRAMRAYPFSVWTYFYFFCSLFGPENYNHLVSLRHRLL
jgi:glycosyltransferase involved in cell wall biosynthesis